LLSSCGAAGACSASTRDSRGRARRGRASRAVATRRILRATGRTDGTDGSDGTGAGLIRLMRECPAGFDGWRGCGQASARGVPRRLGELALQEVACVNRPAAESRWDSDLSQRGERGRGRRVMPAVISLKKRTLRRAFACERRFGERSPRLMPSHSLTEARRHGGEGREETRREERSGRKDRSDGGGNGSPRERERERTREEEERCQARAMHM
jgi:hypothetical protein